MDNKNEVSAKVVYEDVGNNNQLIDSRGISGQTNQSVNPETYKKYIPDDYQFVNFGRFNQSLKNNDVDIIYVKKESASVDKGSIMVDYINANNQLIGHNKFTSKVGNQFNISQCKATMPKGYKLNQILTGRNIDTFKSRSQIMVVQITKIRYAHVVIKYIDNDQSVGQAKAKGAVGTAFNIDRYTKNLPAGYQFVSLRGRVPKAFQNDREIDVEVKKVQPKPKAQVKPSDVKPSDTQKVNPQSEEDPEKIGKILMKLASSLHDLGLTISKSHKL